MSNVSDTDSFTSLNDAQIIPTTDDDDDDDDKLISLESSELNKHGSDNGFFESRDGPERAKRQNGKYSPFPHNSKVWKESNTESLCLHMDISEPTDSKRSQKSKDSTDDDKRDTASQEMNPNHFDRGTSRETVGHKTGLHADDSENDSQRTELYYTEQDHSTMADTIATMGETEETIDLSTTEKNVSQGDADILNTVESVDTEREPVSGKPPKDGHVKNDEMSHEANRSIDFECIQDHETTRVRNVEQNTRQTQMESLTGVGGHDKQVEEDHSPTEPNDDAKTENDTRTTDHIASSLTTDKETVVYTDFEGNGQHTPTDGVGCVGIGGKQTEDSHTPGESCYDADTEIDNDTDHSVNAELIADQETLRIGGSEEPCTETLTHVLFIDETDDDGSIKENTKKAGLVETEKKPIDTGINNLVSSAKIVRDSREARYTINTKEQESQTKKRSNGSPEINDTRKKECSTSDTGKVRSEIENNTVGHESPTQPQMVDIDEAMEDSKNVVESREKSQDFDFEDDSYLKRELQKQTLMSESNVVDDGYDKTLEINGEENVPVPGRFEEVITSDPVILKRKDPDIVIADKSLFNDQDADSDDDDDEGDDTNDDDDEEEEEEEEGEKSQDDLLEEETNQGQNMLDGTVETTGSQRKDEKLPSSINENKTKVIRYSKPVTSALPYTKSSDTMHNRHGYTTNREEMDSMAENAALETYGADDEIEDSWNKEDIPCTIHKCLLKCLLVPSTMLKSIGLVYSREKEDNLAWKMLCDHKSLNDTLENEYIKRMCYAKMFNDIMRMKTADIDRLFDELFQRTQESIDCIRAEINNIEQILLPMYQNLYHNFNKRKIANMEDYSVFLYIFTTVFSCKKNKNIPDNVRDMLSAIEYEVSNKGITKLPTMLHWFQGAIGLLSTVNLKQLLRTCFERKLSADLDVEEEDTYTLQCVSNIVTKRNLLLQDGDNIAVLQDIQMIITKMIAKSNDDLYFSEPDEEKTKETALYRSKQRMILNDSNKVKRYVIHANIVAENVGQTTRMPRIWELNSLLNVDSWRKNMDATVMSKNLESMLAATKDFITWSKRYKNEMTHDEKTCLLRTRTMNECCNDMLGEAMRVSAGFEVMKPFHFSPVIVYQRVSEAADMYYQAHEVSKACLLLILLSMVKRVVFVSSGECNGNTVIITSGARQYYESRQTDMNVTFNSGDTAVLSTQILDRVLTCMKKKESLKL